MHKIMMHTLLCRTFASIVHKQNCLNLVQVRPRVNQIIRSLLSQRFNQFSTYDESPAVLYLVAENLRSSFNKPVAKLSVVGPQLEKMPCMQNSSLSFDAEVRLDLLEDSGAHEMLLFRRIMDNAHGAAPTLRKGRDLTTEKPFFLLTVAKRGFEVYSVCKAPGDAANVTKGVSKDAPGKSLTPCITPKTVLTMVASWSNTGSDIAEISEAANWIAIGAKDGVNLVNPQCEFRVEKTLPIHGCKRVFFSPKGTFLGALRQVPNGSQEHNFSIWSIEKATVVHSFHASSAAERWPPVTWTNNETYCFRPMARDVIVYRGDFLDVNREKTFTKVEVEGVRALAVAPETPTGSVCVATFVPPNKDKPGCCRIHSIASVTAAPTLLNSKSFFQVQDVLLLWNHLSNALLIVAQTDVDSTGRSYYGTSSLYYMEAAPSGTSFQVLGQDSGPISACQWCPSSNEFAVINGPVPCTLTLYDGKTGEPKLSFGKNRRNFIRFNPFGRFICFGGFGNMAGEVDIWDKNKKKVIGQTKLPCTVLCEWAPDGRTLLAATTAPRMRVDNGVKIIRYNGDVLAHLEIPDLYCAKWVTAVTGTHTDRAPSRVRPAVLTSKDSSKEQVKKTQPYRPPNVTAEFRERLKTRYTSEDEGKTVATVIHTASNLPPGALFVNSGAGASKSARRNAARRRKAKETKQAKQTDTVGEEVDHICD